MPLTETLTLDQLQAEFQARKGRKNVPTRDQAQADPEATGAELATIFATMLATLNEIASASLVVARAAHLAGDDQIRELAQTMAQHAIQGLPPPRNAQPNSPEKAASHP